LPQVLASQFKHEASRSQKRLSW